MTDFRPIITAAEHKFQVQGCFSQCCYSHKSRLLSYVVRSNKGTKLTELCSTNSWWSIARWNGYWIVLNWKMIERKPTFTIGTSLTCLSFKSYSTFPMTGKGRQGGPGITTVSVWQFDSLLAWMCNCYSLAAGLLGSLVARQLGYLTAWPYVQQLQFDS